MEREVKELKARLAQREGWEARRLEIERELGRVWVVGGGELEPPGYLLGGGGGVVGEVERGGGEE